MENRHFINGFLQDSCLIGVNASIEAILGFSPNPLEIRPAEELEDPPETLHMAWGLWLHHRDALHRLDQKYDIGHVLRNARAADDILHYLDYVPKIGHDEHGIELHEVKFEYDYLHENNTYSIKITSEEEFDEPEYPNGISLLEELGNDSANSDNEHEPEFKEPETLPRDANSKEDISFGLKKDLMEILKISELGIEYILCS